MKKTIMISIALTFLFGGCSNKEKHSTKTDIRNTNHIEVNTSDDKPLKLPF